MIREPIEIIQKRENVSDRGFEYTYIAAKPGMSLRSRMKLTLQMPPAGWAGGI
jgi:hypothetical protein